MWWKIVLFVIPGLVVIISMALIYGTRRRESATREMHIRLEGARLPITPATYNSTELNGLPAPVQRYFRAVLQDGQPMIEAVSLEQSGTFNLSESGEQWKPFSATQRVVIRRPGFDWEGRITMMPGLTIRVHDAYIAGEGILHASLFGLLSLARQRGTPEMAQGELLRFLAETAWYPTALLPGQGIQWEAVDDTSARATLKDGETTVSLLFLFGEDGLIRSARAEARGRMVSREVIPTPWEGRWSNYELRNGVRIPLVGEVAWILPEGAKPYWRGRITSIKYEFAK